MNLDLLAANAGLIWIGAAILLGGAELAAPGVFLAFFAIAAAMTGVALIALPALPLSFQLLSFALWSAATIAIGHRWYRDYPVETADPLLNDRAARMIGIIVTVTAAIEHGEGRVRVGDGEWSATGANAAVGDRVRVVAVRGGKLAVEPVAPPAPLAGDM